MSDEDNPAYAERFNRDIEKTINHYVDEYDLTYPEMVGILQMHVIDLHMLWRKDAHPDTEDE